MMTVLAALLLMNTSPAQMSETTDRELVAKASVVIDGCGGGTMVIVPEKYKTILRDGEVLVVTSTMCIQSRPVWVTFPNVKETDGKFTATLGDSFRARVLGIGSDKTFGVAILAVPAPRRAQPVPVLLEKSEFMEERPLVACGFARATHLEVLTGVEKKWSSDKPTTNLLFSEAVKVGWAGGGVFDDRNRLIGVNWGQLVETKGALFTRTSSVEVLLEKALKDASPKK